MGDLAGCEIEGHQRSGCINNRSVTNSVVMLLSKRPVVLDMKDVARLNGRLEFYEKKTRISHVWRQTSTHVSDNLFMAGLAVSRPRVKRWSMTDQISALFYSASKIYLLFFVFWTQAKGDKIGLPHGSKSATYCLVFLRVCFPLFFDLRAGRLLGSLDRFDRRCDSGMLRIDARMVCMNSAFSRPSNVFQDGLQRLRKKAWSEGEEGLVSDLCP